MIEGGAIDYPAALVDQLCGQIENTKRGRAHKTAAYQAALCQLTHDRERATFGAWLALAMCAWSEGADQEVLDRDRIQAERFFGISGISEPGMTTSSQKQREEA